MPTLFSLCNQPRIAPAVVFGISVFLATLHVTAEEKKAESPVVEALKERLKPHETKLLDARAAMLKECDEEIKKLDEVIKKAQEVVSDPKSEREARSKAAKELGQAQGTRAKLQSMRSTIEMRYHVPSPPRKAPPPPEDQRLGIYHSPPSTLLVKQLGLKKDEGLVIDHVSKNSPAEKSGLQQYDILVQIDGKPAPSSTTALRKLLASLKVGTAFEVIVLRQGKQETLKGLTVPAVDSDEPKKPETKAAPIDVKPVDKDRPKDKDKPSTDKK